MKRIAESILIDRPCSDVFAFLENRSNDSAWMVSVQESHWLNPDDPTGIGRRGRMIIKIGRRRAEFIDEVTGYEPGRRIAHRTVQGPFPLDTACICEPSGGGCRATVVGEADRLVGGPFGRLVEPFVARGVRRSFRADLVRLKQILEDRANTPG